MTAAVSAVKGGMNRYKASKEFGVPRNTLRYRVDCLDGGTKKPYEKTADSYLLGKHEIQLVDRILHLQRMGFGLTVTEVRKLAYDFIAANGLKEYSSEKKLAGWDWFYSFMKRHPNLNVRAPQSISIARAECTNRPVVYAFFDMFEDTVNKLGLRNSPNAIYNCDETGLQLCVRPTKVVAARGDRSVLQISNSERGENVTVLACCSASGQFLPPFTIFKGKRRRPEFDDNMPAGSSVTLTDSGYISSETFLEFLKHFNRHKCQGPAILVVDGHASHVKSLAVLDYAVQQDITMISLPPHTTHFLQPLDRAFFKPLKAYYYQACRTFIANHPGRSITKLQFGSLLSEGWGKASSTSNATNGFRICGLFPVNRHALPEHIFLPSQVSEVINNSESIAVLNQTEMSAERSTVEPAASAEPSASASHFQSSLLELSTSAATSPQQSSVEPSSSTPLSLRPSDPSTSGSSSTFRDLAPTPKINRTVKLSKRRQSATVLTSESYRKVLFDKGLDKTATKCKSVSKQVKNNKGKQPTKKSKTDGDRNNKENYCGECGCCYFDDDPDAEEEWISCQGCGKWYHETCVDAVNNIYFKCNRCK